MHNDIILTRTIDIHCWRVEATIAIAKTRNDLMPVLMQLQENETATPADIAQQLLFDNTSRKVVAERLLHIAELYALVTHTRQTYTLTEQGHTALETKQVFVPDQGVWTVWASQDPLLPFPVLSYSPYDEPGAREEIYGKSHDEKPPEREFKHLPRWLYHIIGTVAAPGIGGKEVRFDELKKKAEPVAELVTNSSLKLVWNISKARLQLKGQLDGRTINSELPAPDVTADKAWQQILHDQDLLDDWDPQDQSLAVTFDQTDADERQSMSGNISFEQPDIEDYASFDLFTAQGITLRAASNEDAQAWTQWRLEENISNYANQARFSNWCEQAKSPFAAFTVELPTRQALAEHHWQNRQDRPSRQTWHLIAAQDWQL